MTRKNLQNQRPWAIKCALDHDAQYEAINAQETDFQVASQPVVFIFDNFDFIGLMAGRMVFMGFHFRELSPDHHKFATKAPCFICFPKLDSGNGD